MLQAIIFIVAGYVVSYFAFKIFMRKYKSNESFKEYIDHACDLFKEEGEDEFNAYLTRQWKIPIINISTVVVILLFWYGKLLVNLYNNRSKRPPKKMF